MEKKRVAIFVSDFPVVSETFVIQQIATLIDSGFDVSIIAGVWGDKLISHPLYINYNMVGLVTVIREARLSAFVLLMKALFFFGYKVFKTKRYQLARIALRSLQDKSYSSFVDLLSVGANGKNSCQLGDFDLVIAHFGPSGVRAMNLRDAGLMSGSILTVFHGYDMSNFSLVKNCRAGYQRLFRTTEGMLPISEFWKRRLVSWGAPEHKINVLRMGVDLQTIRYKENHRGAGQVLNILSVARFTEKKGLIYAISAIREVSCPLRYVIVGSGPLEADLRELASGMPADKQVVFLGKQNQAKVFELLGESDVFLLPSITAADGDMEGIPVSLMEAMAAGVVVIATKHSGNSELVEDGVSGYLVAERDSKDIAQKIMCIYESNDGALQLRRSARKKVEEDFDASVLSKRLLEICNLM